MLTVRDLDRLTTRVFETDRPGARLDAYRIDETYFIDIDLPGTDPASIDVTMNNDQLTVRAERQRIAAEHPARQAKPVTRHVRLESTIDTDRLEAHCSGNVVTLRIPVSAGTGTN